MMIPWEKNDHKLTGKTRFRIGRERVGWRQYRQVLILQVQETYETRPMIGTEKPITKIQWRDMRVEDFMSMPV